MKTEIVSITNRSRPTPKSNLKTHISTCTVVYTPIGKNKLLAVLQPYEKRITKGIHILMQWKHAALL